MCRQLTLVGFGRGGEVSWGGGSVEQAACAGGGGIAICLSADVVQSKEERVQAIGAGV